MILPLDQADISFLSVGESCATAHQIRRFTQSENAFFYDWIATTDNSFKGILTKEGELLQSGNWELADDGDRLLDKANGIRYRHEFPYSDPIIQHVDPAQVESKLDAARKKFLYLGGKTIEMISSTQNICLICYMENASDLTILKKSSEIITFFGIFNPQIRVVIASNAEVNERISEYPFFIRVNKGITWMGDDQSWDRLFNIVLSNWAKLT